MRVRLMMLALLLALPVLAAGRSPEPSPEPPPDRPKSEGPIEVRLVARKTKYVLDRQGMTAEAYRKAVQDGKIPPPAADLVLEFKNVDKKDHDVRITGAVPTLTLNLEGKGKVVTRTSPRVRQRVSYATLKPGEKYEMPITQLAGYTSGQSTELFWTEPGEYTLSVTFQTVLRTPPPGRKFGRGANPFPANPGANPPGRGKRGNPFIPQQGKGPLPVAPNAAAPKGAAGWGKANGRTTFTTQKVTLTVTLK